VDGKDGLGKALRFGGTNDSVFTTGALPIDRDKFTIAFWLKLGGIDSAQTILNVGGSSLVQVDSNNKIDFLGVTSAALDDLNTTWHHIAVQWDKENTTAKIFVDGDEDGTNNSASMVGSHGDSASIGDDGSSSSGLSTGSLLDELGIWTTDLDTELISVLYNDGSGFKDFLTRQNLANDLTAYYAFEGGLTSSVGDGLTAGNTDYTFVQGKVGRAIRFDNEGSTKLN
jgi:hypothetical protein